MVKKYIVFVCEIYNLAENVEKFSKFGKIGFSAKFFRVDSLQIFRTTVKISFRVAIWVLGFISKHFRIFLNFPNFLRS